MKGKSQAFRENLVHYAIYSIIAFILLSTILSFWNRHVTYDTRSIIEKIQETKNLTNAIQEKIIANIELGVDSYLVTGDESKLTHFTWASIKKDSIFGHLERNLKEEGYKSAELKGIADAVDEYEKKAIEIIKATKETASSNLKDATIGFNFRGSESYTKFKSSVFEFVHSMEDGAKSDYEWSIVDNAIIQIILVLLSIPILIIASRKLGREVRNNHELLSSLAANNKRYLYDDGEESQINAKSVVEKSIESFKKAFDFVENVAKGKFDQAQALLPGEVRPLNESTLMGALLEMSTKLRENEEADQKRQWISSGLNEFYEIVRNSQTDTNMLADKVVSFLTRYLKSQQGSLFTLRKDNDQEYLQLDACFAYDRKKWMDRRIEIGDGMLGQAFLEGETLLITQIPKGYTSITSGLGDATPSCLLIEPFRYNDKIEAMFEIAGFMRYEEHHIEFLKKAGEILAAALNSAKNNSEMQALLNQSREQAEALKSQEEELRQNMEELEATNEAMRRHENV